MTAQLLALYVMIAPFVYKIISFFRGAK